jgi:hypothetical protein
VQNGSVSTPRGGSNTKFFFVANGSGVGSNYLELQAPSNSSADILMSSGSTGAYGILRYVLSSNTMQFWTNSTLQTSIDGSGNFSTVGDIIAYSSSDATLKTNLVPIANPIAKVQKLTGYEFDWTDEYLNSIGTNDICSVRKHDVGLVAQEVETVIPEVVNTKANGIKGVKYDRLVALLIEAVKDQQEQIDELRTELKNLKS